MQRTEHRRWAQVNPNGPTAHREWAEFLLEHGSGDADLALAVSTARRARKLTPGDDAMIYVTLAEALKKSGKTDEIEDLLRLAEEVPNVDERARDQLKTKIKELRGG